MKREQDLRFTIYLDTEERQRAIAAFCIGGDAVRYAGKCHKVWSGERMYVVDEQTGEEIAEFEVKKERKITVSHG